jgi:hypothetical protein
VSDELDDLDAELQRRAEKFPDLRAAIASVVPQDKIATLTAKEARDFAQRLVEAVDNATFSVSFVVQNDGIKVKIDETTWSPGYGRKTRG